MFKFLFSLSLLCILSMPCKAAEYLICSWAVPKLDYFPSHNTTFEMDNQNKKLSIINSNVKTALTTDLWNDYAINVYTNKTNYFFDRTSGSFEYIKDGVLVGRGMCTKSIGRKF